MRSQGENNSAKFQKEDRMQLVKMMVYGVSDILMHNPAAMRQGGEEALQRGGKKIPPPLDEARTGLYVSPDDQLYIGSDCFREAGLTASKDIRDPTRKGRATMTKRFAASVFLCTEHCLLYRADGNHAPIMATPEPTGIGDKSGEWEIYRKRVVVQKQGILRSRPRIGNWCCPLEFEYDEETIDENLILAIMIQSGKYPGVLDYRVEKKGPFGRYTAQFANGADLGGATKLSVKKGRRK
jgi:hypothetical protein